MTKLYIIGCWQDREAIKTQWIKPLDLKYNIVHDWTVYDDGKRGPENLQEAAMIDLAAVERADVVVAIMAQPQTPTTSYRGTFAALGASYVLKKPVIIFNPAHDRTKDHGIQKNVHYWLPNHFYATTAEEVVPLIEAICLHREFTLNN